LSCNITIVSLLVAQKPFVIPLNLQAICIREGIV
jgi:hypothetical protein